MQSVGGVHLPLWFLKVMRRTKSDMDEIYERLIDSYNFRADETIIFARSVNDARGVVCTNYGRVMYIDKQLHDGVPKYTETVRNVILPARLIKFLIDQPADYNYNEQIDLCLEVSASIHYAALAEEVKNQHVLANAKLHEARVTLECAREQYIELIVLTEKYRAANTKK